jgi:predicted transcriptional regulator
MSYTITIRLTKDLAQWLEETAARAGVSQSQLIREQIEKVKAENAGRAFMRLAGAVRGPKDLSRRKGFSKP